MKPKITNLSDLVKKTSPRLYNETIFHYKKRHITKYIPIFKEMMLFNDSIGVLNVPLSKAFGDFTLDDFSRGYVTMYFDISVDKFKELDDC
jgi:hypothetical protein